MTLNLEAMLGKASILVMMGLKNRLWDNQNIMLVIMIKVREKGLIKIIIL